MDSVHSKMKHMRVRRKRRASAETTVSSTARILPSSADGPSTPTMGEVGLNHFVPYLLNRISATWNANLQDVLKPFDMTTMKMRVLAVLSVMPGVTINELAIHAVAEQPTMSRTLDAMEELGLVRRQPRPDDMRVREIYMTDEGRVLFSRIWEPMYELYTHLFDGVDEDELRALIGTLHKVLRNIRSQEF